MRVKLHVWWEGMRTRDDTTSSGVVDGMPDALGRGGFSNLNATKSCKRGVVWRVRWNAIVYQCERKPC
jgi:hypothetical protein